MCVVTADRLFGSVGGGSIEYQMAQAARRLLDSGKSSVYRFHKVILFGAGHVSEYVSKLAKMVGFHVTVIDDRAELANKERFPDADTVIVDGLETVFDQLHITMASYIVILTRGLAAATFEVMSILEGSCARLAAERLTNADLAELEKLHEKLEEHYRGNAPHAYVQDNRCYHEFIQETDVQQLCN